MTVLVLGAGVGRCRSKLWIGWPRVERNDLGGERMEDEQVLESEMGGEDREIALSMG